MEIKFGETTKNEAETGAEFPIYRKFSADFDEGRCIIYTRIMENMKMVEIRYSAPHDEGRENYEVTFGTADLSPSDSRDYRLGLGEYASNEAEFNTILGELKGRLKAV